MRIETDVKKYMLVSDYYYLIDDGDYLRITEPVARHVG